MENREDLQQQMLELIYGLLSDEQSAELAERISSDRELAVTYAELKEQTELLADATRAAPVAPPDFEAWKQAAGIDRKPPHKSKPLTRPPAAPPNAARRWTSRGLQIAAALAACLLLFAVGYPYFATPPQNQLALTQQQTSLADDFLAVSITGPKLMAAQLSNRFQVSIHNAAEEPVDAEVEYTFKSSNGSTVYYGRTQAVDGQMIAQIPPDEVSHAATLEVVARQGKAQSQLGLDLQVAPQRPITVLQTDRQFVEPGDTVNFRAVVLDPQTQQEQSTPIEFYWKSGDAGQLAEVPQAERQTRDGVALGRLIVPAAQPSDEIELAAHSPLFRSQFAQAALPVVPAEAPEQQLRAAANFRRQRGALPQQAFAAGALAYTVVPEGGNLVAGVQNRIYYQALPQTLPQRLQPQAAAPLSRNAQVVDAQRQLIRNLPPSQTELGSFLLTPEATQQYSLELNEAAEQVEQQLAPVQQLPATLQVTNGVAPADQPLEVDVRVAQANITMALVVGDDDAAIGHHLWDVGVNAPITQPITIDLPSEATGAQRVRLYQVADEATAAEPRLLAERIIYRIPTRRFHVAIEGLPATVETGQAVNLQIDVIDEYGGPAPATLGVQWQRVPEDAPFDFLPIGLEAEALLHSRVRLPEGSAPLPTDLRALEQVPVRFDQLLALSQWREAATPAGQMPLVADADHRASAEPLPVVHRSNLAAVLQEYESAVTQLKTRWEGELEQIRHTSAWLITIAGSVLTVCLLALAVVQGLPRVGVWGPGLLVALGAVLWGLLSFNLPLAESPTADRTLIARHDGERVVDRLNQAEKADSTLSMEAAGSAPADSAPADSAPAERAPAAAQLRSVPRGDAADAYGADDSAVPMVPGAAMGGLGGGNIAPFSQPATDAATPRMLRGAGLPAAPAREAAEPEAPASDAPVGTAEAGRAQANAEPANGSSSDPVVWQPRLPTNNQGQAAISVAMPNTPGRYRLLVDAHGAGRLGTIVRYVEVTEPAVASPPPPE